MDGPCRVCLMRNEGIDRISYNAVVDALQQVTSLLKLKANSGNYDSTYLHSYSTFPHKGQ